MLRSGRQLKGPKGASDEVGSQTEQEKGVAPLPSESEPQEKRESEKSKESKTLTPKPYMPFLPFPQRFAKAKLDSQFGKFSSSVSLMPYSIINRLGLVELRPTSISLKLADGSIKYPLGIFEDLPINASDFYVPIDFVILDMAEDFRTQIILGGPFLATAGCKIDVKEGKLTFDVGKHHAEFGLFKDFEPSPSTHSYYGREVFDSNEPMSMLDMTLNDPFSFDCTLFDGSGLDGVMVDPLPPSIIEDKLYAIDEGYVSDCCNFVTLMMSMPLRSGGVPNFEVDVELKFGPFDGNGTTMTMLLDLSLQRTIISKKDLNLKILRWVLLMHQSDFEVLDKG